MNMPLSRKPSGPFHQKLVDHYRIARRTVERLMKAISLQGVLRGKCVRTTFSRKTETLLDRVNRRFVAERPEQL